MILSLTNAALVFHLGGFIVSSAATVPRAKIEYLVEAGFIVVVPNYRLTPRLAATKAFEDCEHAYEWALGALPGISKHCAGAPVDPTRIVAMGHSSGGTLA